MADDNPANRRLITAVLKAHGFEPHVYENGQDAMNAVMAHPPAAVILDVQMPGMSGLDVLRSLRQQQLDVPVLMLTAYGEISMAVESIRLGADDFLTRPIENEQLVRALRRAIAKEWQPRGKTAGGPEPEPVAKPSDVDLAALMGTSVQIQDLTNEVRSAAGTEMTTLLLGETGTGKELVARAVHAGSARRHKRLIAIDCGAIPDNLLESELFGYERGAFSGADKRKEGLFELANGGTLFLDEIGNLSLVTQAKLLRVLQERVLHHLGGDRIIEVDCRIIAATNEDLMNRVNDGRFRADLYYRLAEFVVRLPPLRDRKADIEPLATRFVNEVSRELGRDQPKMTIGYLEALRRYNWPGNVRELRNIVRQTVVRSRGELQASDLEHVMQPRGPMLAPEATAAVLQPVPIAAKGSVAGMATPGSSPTAGASPSGLAPAGDSLKAIADHAADEAERLAIIDALNRTGWNKTAAARMLKVDFKTLHSKMKRLRLQASDEDVD